MVVFIFIILIYILLQFVSFRREKRAIKFFSFGGFPIIFAHRGASLLFPENTKLAFEKSFEMGTDAFETDIRLTKDGYIITHHNDDIDETSDGSGMVIDFTYDELKKFNFGCKFKDLNGNMPYIQKKEGLYPMNVEDLFKEFNDKVLYSIDIKDEKDIGKESARILYNLVKKYNLQKNVIFASFHDEITDYLREISNNDIVISGSKNKTKIVVYSSLIGVDSFFNYKTNGLQIPTSYKVLKLSCKYLIYKLHKHHMFCHYWTINTKEEMKDLLYRKVDAITTDRLDLILELKKEYLKEKLNRKI